MSVVWEDGGDEKEQCLCGWGDDPRRGGVGKAERLGGIAIDREKVWAILVGWDSLSFWRRTICRLLLEGRRWGSITMIFP